MTEHIVKAFSEQLESLTTTVAQMGGLVESQLADAVEAIARRDTALAEKTIAGDARVDQFQVSIEEQSLKLLALRQPMAVDLR
ncbi:MAG TPA: PhoU domain-containing protein, partial [Rhizomicrobium sp.]|nr:PhoU domain-containing protein [Rhizomicrobium sp.]